jgi:inner membrane protein
LTSESIGELASRIAGSTLVKLGVLGVLAGLLLIPVALVLSLVHERQTRLHDVRDEVASTWGKPQTLIGPVLVLPFVSRDETASPGTAERGRHQLSEVVILPSSLQVRGNLEPERRRRGIFEAVVYSSRAQLTGSFSPPHLDRLGISRGDVDWSAARLLLSVSDPHGLMRPIELRWAGAPGSLTVAGPDRSIPGVVLSTPLASLATRSTKIPFTVDLELRGTGTLQVAPVGAETMVSLRGRWGSPSFIGGFLPSDHEVSRRNFVAAWHVSDVSRPYPRQWRLDRVDTDAMARAVAESTVGVDLTIPADAYQQTERTAKYAILFITLTFGTFLLCELATGSRLHPVQYLLIGAALCLYYLLLLSLTEHLGFDVSYWTAVAATITLIAGYTRAILASRRLAVILFAWLVVLYGYLYFILRLKDYALLAGALGLFAILAAFMWVTRRLDWYTLSFKPVPQHQADIAHAP